MAKASEARVRVAIALQGGGSHAAFAAGVLKGVLGSPRFSQIDLVALSGTSGGAVCAALAWSGLVSGKPDAAGDAVRRLAAFWRELEADDLVDAATNFWGLWLARLPVVAEVSPYAYEPAAAPAMYKLLQEHVALEKLPAEPRRPARPKLLLGATDILTGTGMALPVRRKPLTYDDIVASAAIPPLFRAVRTPDGLFWDGLFSRNPPIREFTDLPKGERPDEIWVVRINPKGRAHEPRSMPEIIDRRNELSGNLALEQELYFIKKINDLRAEHPDLCGRYDHIEVREVALDRPDLDYASKLDRSPALLRSLLQAGEAESATFLQFPPR
jgi:NTE family protein